MTETELPLYNKPCFPNGPGTSRVATMATGPKLMAATAPPSGNGEFDVSPHGNPVTAFDTRNVWDRSCLKYVCVSISS